MGFFERWRRRRAAKAYAGKLGPGLARTYGASEHYTPEQIRASAQRLGLDLGYVCLGLACFLPELEYAKLAPSLPLALGYDEARDLVARYLSHGPWSGPLGETDFSQASLGATPDGSPPHFGGGDVGVGDVGGGGGDSN